MYPKQSIMITHEYFNYCQLLKKQTENHSKTRVGVRLAKCAWRRAIKKLSPPFASQTHTHTTTSHILTVVLQTVVRLYDRAILLSVYTEQTKATNGYLRSCA